MSIVFSFITCSFFLLMSRPMRLRLNCLPLLWLHLQQKLLLRLQHYQQQRL
jgi:hypothetical protein